LVDYHRDEIRPMTFLPILDITEAFRAVLRGEHELTDATRKSAQQQVRTLVEDRVFVGRKPQTVTGGHVLLSVADVEREYLLSGEMDSCRTLVEVTVADENRRRMLMSWEGIRQAFTSLKTSVTTQDGAVVIQGCTLESESEPPPDGPVDASQRFTYVYQGFFRVTHSAKVPSGVK